MSALDVIVVVVSVVVVVVVIVIVVVVSSSDRGGTSPRLLSLPLQIATRKESRQQNEPKRLFVYLAFVETNFLFP